VVPLKTIPTPRNNNLTRQLHAACQALVVGRAIRIGRPSTLVNHLKIAPLDEGAKQNLTTNSRSPCCLRVACACQAIAVVFPVRPGHESAHDGQSTGRNLHAGSQRATTFEKALASPQGCSDDVVQSDLPQCFRQPGQC